MEPGEQELGGTHGRLLQVVKNSQGMHDADWTSGRTLLSNRWLILAGTGGRRAIQLSKIQEFDSRYDVNQRIATVSDYLSVHIPPGIVLLVPIDYSEFETDLFGALLSTEQFLAQHPAVAGGVVQSTEWEKSQLRVEIEAVNMATIDDKFVGIRLNDISDVKTGERTVVDEHRNATEVERSDDEGTSLQTYISGSDRAVSFLYTLPRKGEGLSEASIELSETGKQVLTALYSGISLFSIPNFLGLDVDEVGRLFQRLIGHNVVEEIRVYHEMQLNARDRSITSGVINEQQPALGFS